MLKVSSKERGEAAEKRELAKLNIIKISKAEMKKLNEIVHSRELVKENTKRKIEIIHNKETRKYKIKVVVERNNNVVSASREFYCCGSSWPAGIQCFVCNNSCDMY
jgi:hypothetical protein